MTYEQKRAVIESLLDHWQDFILPSVGGLITGDGEGLGIKFASGMGTYPSVVELNRCLGLLESKVPNHFSHLKGWYGSEWRTVSKPIERPNPRRGGKPVKDVVRARERVIPSWVMWRLVDRGLDMLVALWDMAVVLELPPGLNRRLRQVTTEDGTYITEAAA